MKLNGTHKFNNVSSDTVYNAILTPSILQSSIPGCDSVEFLDANRVKINVTTPLPGLKGPYGIVVGVQQTSPNQIVLNVQRQGRGGSVNATSTINIQEDAGGALLTYDANADLDGPVAIVNNPIGQGITKNSLNSFFKNLDSAISK